MTLVEPVNTLPLEQEAVKRKNPTREMTQHFDFLTESGMPYHKAYMPSR